MILSQLKISFEFEINQNIVAIMQTPHKRPNKRQQKTHFIVQSKILEVIIH